MKNIEKLFNAKWVAGGREYDGLDCYGLFMVVRRDEFGLKEFPDPRIGGVIAAAFNFNNESMDKKAYENKIIKLSTPTDGCLVRMRGEASLPTHCGIYIGKGRIAHIERITNDINEKPFRINTVAELKDRILDYWEYVS